MNPRQQPSLLLLLVFSAGLISSCTGQGETPATASATPSRTPILLGPTSTASLTPTPPTQVDPTSTVVPLATVAPDEPSLGPDNASVRMLLYLDYVCGPCEGLADTVHEIQAGHSGEVQLVLRPFPLLEVHALSGLAVAAVLAAHKQDAFWPMHNALLDQRSTWIGMDVQTFTEWLEDTASTLGLDAGAFGEDLTSTAITDDVERAYRRALASGVPGAPFLLINQQPYLLGADPARLEAAVRLNLLEDRQFSEPPGPVIDPGAPYGAVITLSQGELQLQLYPRFSPRGVNSFVFLAREGWYDRTAFHRVVPNRLAEAGDPTLTGLGDAGYHFDLETHPSLSFDEPGMVALDNAGPGTNSARFFVTLSELPSLTGNYTIIGRVTQGLQWVQDLDAREPLDDLFEPPQAMIETIEVFSR